MARRVYFSFHFERDVWRANIVRNSWVSKDREAAGFFDAAEYEKVKKQGDASIKAWIDNQMDGTSVTTILIGAETSKRDWVRYEVKRSHEKKKGLLGVYIHSIENQQGRIDTKGDDYFGEIGKDENGNTVYFWQLYPTYDWKANGGYESFGKWVEEAARKAGR